MNRPKLDPTHECPKCRTAYFTLTCEECDWCPGMLTVPTFNYLQTNRKESECQKINRLPVNSNGRTDRKQERRKV